MNNDNEEWIRNVIAQAVATHADEEVTNMPLNRSQRRAVEKGEGIFAEQTIIFIFEIWHECPHDDEGASHWDEILVPVLSSPHKVTWETVCTQLTMAAPAIAGMVEQVMESGEYPGTYQLARIELYRDAMAPGESAVTRYRYDAVRDRWVAVRENETLEQLVN